MPSRRFPLQAALGALLIYGLTLSWGITVNSLPLAAKVAGWDWRPMAGQPVLWLLTLPLRCLPAGWVPVALNLFSAVCGAAVLGMLARSAELLVCDRPQNALKGWGGRLPALLACVACGLEFSFWREATAASGEMLSLLLLAAAIWCLLEYRAAREPRWLTAAAVIWGLGMAENWVMQIGLPVFVVAVVALAGARFLNWNFLARMALLVLAGFSVYLLLPMVNGLTPHSPWSFGEAWVMTLKTTKHTLGMLYGGFWRAHRLVAIAVAVFFLVPTLPCLLRLHDEDTRNKSGIDRLQIWLFRALRGVLLLACLWLAFDPEVGPRQIVLQQIGLALPLVTFDYLNALGIGYLAGSLWLVLQPMLERRSRRDEFRRFRSLAAPALVVALGLVAGGLLLRNAPGITLANRQPLASFGALAVRSLPAGGGVVLSDDPQKLLVFQAALSHQRAVRDWQAVDTASLPSPEYRAALERQHPAGWLTAENRHELKPQEALQLIEQVARSNRLCYLHPSFGYFFERFYLQPHDAVFEMKLCDLNQLGAPPLTPPETARMEKFWDETWASELEAISRTVWRPAVSRRPKGGGKILRSLHVGAVSPVQSQLLGEWFSISLNTWGVELQRAGQMPAARQRFEQALALNTNNLAARINHQNNTNLQAGKHLNLAGLSEAAGWFRDVQRLGLIMNRFGPFDDPVICYLMGSSYQQRGQLRLAAQQFERARTLAPDAPASELALAEIYSRVRMDDKVFEIVKHLRTLTQTMPATNSLDVELSLLEANAWLSQTNPANARGVLQSILKKHPDDDRVLNLVVKAYLVFGDFTTARQLMAGQLARNPDDVVTLNNQAAMLLQMGDATNALPLLNHALAITNLPSLRLNRAFARLQIQDLPAAEADFLELDKSQVEPCRVHLGLAEIAGQRHDTNLAIHHLTVCLSNLPPENPLWKQIRARLDTLAPAARKKS